MSVFCPRCERWCTPYTCPSDWMEQPNAAPICSPADTGGVSSSLALARVTNSDATPPLASDARGNVFLSVPPGILEHRRTCQWFAALCALMTPVVWVGSWVASDVGRAVETIAAMVR